VDVYDETMLRWRTTTMDQLEIGNRVRTGPLSSDVSTVYAFGTRDFDTTVAFDRLVTEYGTVLEATENHILFVAEDAIGESEASASSSSSSAAAAATAAAVAWDVEVGDQLLLADPLLFQNNTNGTSWTRIVRKESVVKQGA
jgi:hypothetical protein